MRAVAYAGSGDGSPAALAKAHAGEVVLVESAPVETTLDHPDIPDAYQLWPEMIAGERDADLDLAECPT